MIRCLTLARDAAPGSNKVRNTLPIKAMRVTPNCPQSLKPSTYHQR